MRVELLATSLSRQEGTESRESVEEFELTQGMDSSSQKVQKKHLKKFKDAFRIKTLT